MSHTERGQLGEVPDEQVEPAFPANISARSRFRGSAHGKNSGAFMLSW
jgi:hypothetical protein